MKLRTACSRDCPDACTLEAEVVEVAAVATSGKPCALATVIVRPQDSMEEIA